MLIERAAQLAALDAAVDAALAGRGALVLVSGEAGVGKTALLSAAAQRAVGRLRVLRGVFDNVTTPAPLGALLDASAEMAQLVDEAGSDRPTMFRRVRASLVATPTLLVLDDVHWADGATLDLLRYLGRRLADVPLLVVATYRSDEVVGRHPLTPVLGDLAAEPTLSRIPVPPLSLDAVTRLVVGSGGAVDPVELHHRTGGNAFHVTEVLAAPESDVPATVRDAVLARTMRLSPGAQDVLAAAAVLGQPADALLLAEVAGRTPADVDECTANGLLVADRDGWAFRHVLARLAVEQTEPPGQLLALHRRALAALRARGSDDDRLLARHAAAAGDREAARRHAVGAAQRAARLGAHHEATQHYRTALHYTGDDPPARTSLLVALSYECYLIDEHTESLAARTQALELAELAGDQAALGTHQRWMSRLSWFLGRGADAERYAVRAIGSLEPLGDSRELAMAYSNRSQIAMLAADGDDAEKFGQRALDLARRLGDREVEAHALNNIGSARLQRADTADARSLIQRSLDIALSDDLHEHVARAYTNLGAQAELNRRLADAEADLRAGIAYCAERDLDSWSTYMAAHLACTLATQGRRADEALGLALDLLHRPRLAPVTAIIAATVAAVVPARRGDDPAGWADRAWELAAGTGEAQRLVPAACALAEVAWLTGTGWPVDELDAAWAAARARPSPWELAEVAYWRELAGLDASTDVSLPEPFALLRDGSFNRAARTWQRLGSAVWQAVSLGRGENVESARQAYDLLADLGYPSLWAALARDRHATGLPVPRGPRGVRASNPHGLTAREWDILQMLADGLTNPAIAGRLFLSTRTVDHHVAAVLRKLGQPTRGQAVAAAVREGLFETDRPS